MSKLLFVVPTLGRRDDWLRICLASAQRQLAKGVSVVVVGPSGSAAADVARECDAAYFAYDVPGQSAAINAVWKAVGADYDYFAWLGDDDALSTVSLLVTLDYLDRHPHCAVVYGRVRVILADGATLAVGRPGRLANKLLPYTVNHVPQPGSVFRAVAVRRAGYLDESLSYSMDQDLFLRLRRLGSLDYVPVELAAIRHHPDTVTMGRVDNDREEDAVRERSHTRRESLVYAWCRRPLVLFAYGYSSVIRSMLPGQHDDAKYLDSVGSQLSRPMGPHRKDRHGDGNEVWTDRHTLNLRKMAGWRGPVLRAESGLVTAVVRYWDATGAKRDRRRRLSADVLKVVEARQSCAAPWRYW